MLLDGHDLRDLSFATLRKNMAVVLQDNFLFAGTIADNIRYGRPDATDERSSRRRSWPTPTSSSRASRTATRPR